jgi:DNA-directed RNA polymerase subunit K/omega
MEFQIEDNLDLLKNYNKIKLSNFSKPVLYNNERAAIIGLRAEQINRGSKLMIPVPQDTDNVIEFAKRELDARKTPFILKRKINDNNSDYWKIEDLL